MRLTPRGRAAVVVAREAIWAVEAEWAELLGPGEMASLRRLLEDVRGRLTASAAAT